MELNNKENEFIELIQKNLNLSGYPEKSVQFPLETMYELADSKGVNLNSILDHLRSQGLEIESSVEKITFHKPNLNEDQREDHMAQAKKMMDGMSPEQLKSIQDQVENMTPEQKAQMMEQAKKMGLF